jgi:hypothetical protein
VRVALPWLHACFGEAREPGLAPGALPWLRWLYGRGNVTRAARSDWRRWLVGGAGAEVATALERWPAGPSRAAAAGAGAGSSLCWSVAQPVHLAAGMDHLRMAPLADAVPGEAEAQAIAATLRAHFAGEAFDLLEFVDGAWLVRWTDTVDCVTHDPVAVVGHDVHDYMPAGPDGARVRSLMNEMQMLLHEHPVNERRARQRQAPVNALWLWGFGAFDVAAEGLPGTSGWTLRTDDPWLRAFWHLHGGTEESLAAAGAVVAGHELIALAQPPTSDPGEALAELDSSLLARLASAVRGGALRLLEIHDGARVLTLDAHARLRFWRRPIGLEQW